MGLTGLEGINQAKKAVLELPRVMSQASTDAADNLRDVVDLQFQMGHNPYGRGWAPLSESTLRRGRRPPPLTNEGALNSPHIAPLQSAGVIVDFDEEYASFHQTGTRGMPQRKIVPEPSSFVTSLWYGAVVEAYSNAILHNGGWRTAGADVEESPMAHAAEE